MRIDPLAIIQVERGSMLANSFTEGFDNGLVVHLNEQGHVTGLARYFGRPITDYSHPCGKQIFKGMSYFGQYTDDGKPSGVAWRGVPGGGYLYGRVTDNSDFTGDGIAYIYPDMATVLQGKFINGLMIAGRQVDITHMRCINGMVELKFSEPRGPVFHYEPPTNE